LRNGFLASCLVVACGTLAPAAGAATFTNSTPIVVPPSPGSGVATPYPSTISVSDQPGTTVKARVSFTIAVAAWRDIDALLVGPGGNSILMSDVCGTNASSAINVNLTFDDDASQSLFESCPPTPSAGTYRPTNFDTADSFPGVAPPYLLGLSNFRGISPNGAWQLYVNDDTAGDQVTINGWTLDLTTTGAPSPPPAATPKKKCKKKHRRAAQAKKKRCKKKRKR
jgi:subtilisin-like proprotein convertase family protein